MSHHIEPNGRPFQPIFAGRLPGERNFAPPPERRTLFRSAGDIRQVHADTVIGAPFGRILRAVVRGCALFGDKFFRVWKESGEGNTNSSTKRDMKIWPGRRMGCPIFKQFCNNTGVT